jgi:pimeloyl-ACP methyl ester carboxylesterase
MDMALKLGPEIFVKQSRALQSRPDQQDILTASDCPALILCGREDLLCPIERHELMHHLMKNSHLEIIDQAGHLPTLEQPIKTNQALLRWMER